MKIDITADGATITKVEPGHCVSDEVFVLGDTTDIGDALTALANGEPVSLPRRLQTQMTRLADAFHALSNDTVAVILTTDYDVMVYPEGAKSDASL